mgnify:CR=1 FL=1
MPNFPGIFGLKAGLKCLLDVGGNRLDMALRPLMAMLRSGLAEQGLVLLTPVESRFASGIVITGGSSEMQGMVELGEEIFYLPVRMGIPKYIGGLSDVVKTPRMATGVGLLLYGLEHHQRNEETRMQSNSIGDVLARMKNWLLGNF